MDSNENDNTNSPQPDGPRRWEHEDAPEHDAPEHQDAAEGAEPLDDHTTGASGSDAAGTGTAGRRGFDADGEAGTHHAGAASSAAAEDEATASAPKRRTGLWVGIGVALLAVVLLAVLVMRMLGSNATNDKGADAPVYSPGQSTSAAPTSKPSATAKAVPAGCMSSLKEIDPVRFKIDQMKVDTKMLSLGSDAEGGAGAPPLSDNSSVGWWNQGPKVGSSQGHAILTIHTYRNGGALGNKLYDKSSGLKDGALVRMSDASGNTQCYTVEKQMKVWVKDYDPNSNLLYSNSGSPRAVIVICWDFNRSNEEWDSRVFYYLKPVTLA